MASSAISNVGRDASVGAPFSGAKVTKTADQSIASAINVAVTWESEDYDTDIYHDNSINPSRLTIPAGASGKYRVTAGLHFDAMESGYVVLRVNNSSPSAALTSLANQDACSLSADLTLAAGDYIEVVIYLNSGTGVVKATTTYVRPTFSIQRLDASGTGVAVQVRTTVSGLSAFNGAMARLRLGSSPYEFCDLVYDGTYGKWVGPVIDTGLGNTRATSTPLGTASTTFADVGVDADAVSGSLMRLKEHYDAGLRLQLRWTTFMTNSGANTTTGYISVRECQDAGSTSIECFTSAELFSTVAAGTVKISDWANATVVAAPTLSNGYSYVRQWGKTSAGTGSFGNSSCWARWVSA